MKKICLILICCFVMSFAGEVFADRNTSTTEGFSANALVKRGDWKLYRISYIVTTTTSSFTIHDSLTAGATSETTIKTEGGRAVSGDGDTLDFTNKPLEGSTGLYLVVDNCNVVIEYE